MTFDWRSFAFNAGTGIGIGITLATLAGIWAVLDGLLGWFLKGLRLGLVRARG